MATPQYGDPRQRTSQNAFDVAMGGTRAGGGVTNKTQPVGVGDKIADPMTPPAAAPAPARPAAGDFSRMQGYDQNNWGNMNSLKYQIGEILSRYQASPYGASQALNDPDLRALAPNARFASDNGRNDVIDFGGIVDPHSGASIGQVDVGRAFDPNNPNAETNWVWQDLANDPTGAASAAATQGLGGGGNSVLMEALMANGGLNGDDTLKRIQAELQALVQGGSSPLAMDAFHGAMR